MSPSSVLTSIFTAKSSGCGGPVRYGFDRLLVFRHTQIGVDRLANTLKRRGKNVAALHGGLSQRERDRTLAAFRAGKIQFLIATNVASRGLDITDLPYVLSFDIPEDADTYVHRIGRTGRAGREGTAMPSWRAQDLTDDQISELVTFLKTTQP